MERMILRSRSRRCRKTISAISDAAVIVGAAGAFASLENHIARFAEQQKCVA
jgi:hypothetical protein